MTDINNIPNYGHNVEKIEKNNKPSVKHEAIKPEETQVKQTYVQDTGVLGRSQIKTTKGADVTGSVKAAVDLAQNHPDVLEASETFFDKVLEKFINDGMEYNDAYTSAILAEEAFLEMCQKSC